MTKEIWYFSLLVNPAFLNRLIYLFDHFFDMKSLKKTYLFIIFNLIFEKNKYDHDYGYFIEFKIYIYLKLFYLIYYILSFFIYLFDDF